jgi:hypothetical protein
MPDEKLRSYISNLPVGGVEATSFDDIEAEEIVGAADINNLPGGIVTGSNLLEFTGETTPELRSSVALCLLAAQRVAANDTVIQTPDEWIDRHNTVLRNLNWVIEGGGNVESTFDTTDVTVHEAIIPFLTAAMSGAVAASSLIVTALKQLKEIDKSAPWITLFDRESRRFGVSEFQFTLVDTSAGETRLSMAAARFDAFYGRTQILFWKIKKQDAKFQMAESVMRANASLLESMNEDLKVKLAIQTKAYIRSLDLGD